MTATKNWAIKIIYNFLWLWPSFLSGLSLSLCFCLPCYIRIRKSAFSEVKATRTILLSAPVNVAAATLQCFSAAAIPLRIALLDTTWTFPYFTADGLSFCFWHSGMDSWCSYVGHKLSPLKAGKTCGHVAIKLYVGRSDLSTWKYQFSYDHWSQATLISVSTWMGDCSSVAWVLLLTLKSRLDLISRPILVVGSVLMQS